MTTKVMDYWPVRGLRNRQNPEQVMWQAYEKAMACKTWNELRRVCFEDGLYMPRPNERNFERLNARKQGRALDLDVHRSKDFRRAAAEVGTVLLLAAWSIVEPNGYEDWEDRKRSDFASRLRNLEETGGGCPADGLGVSWEDPGNYISGRWARQFSPTHAAGRVEGPQEGSPFVSVRRKKAEGKSWAAQLPENVRGLLISGD